MKTKTQPKKFDFFPSPRYALMQGRPQAESFLEEFNACADEAYGDAAQHVKVLGYNGTTITGSNIPAVIHVNRILRPQGILTATQADLEAFRSNLRGTYEDSALVLRSAGDSYVPNDHIARNLANQLRGSLKRQVGKVPIVIPLVGLDLVKNAKYSHGLSFKLREDAKPYEAPILSQSVLNFSDQDVDVETGLPIKLGKGDRRSYTRKDGLSRMFLSVGFDLCSSDRDLWGSDSNGRVVLVRDQFSRSL